MQKMTGGLEGVFVINPMWHPALGNSVISGHPLGGCSMGESKQAGVVNHAGQVFDGMQNNLQDIYSAIFFPSHSIKTTKDRLSAKSTT